MEWQVTYNGSSPLEGLEIQVDNPRPDLTEQTLAASKEIRKGKHGHEAMTLKVTPVSLEGTATGSSTPFYQPIGKILFVLTHQDGSIKKVNLFSYVAVDEACRAGAPGAQYLCHTFKCRSDEEANQLAFAVSRTMVGNVQRGKSDHPLDELTPEQIEATVKWWNAHSPRMFHYAVGKDQTVSGVIKFQCQVDKSVKTVSKLVRLSNLVKGDELLKLLGEKFNLGEINPSDFAVFIVRDAAGTDQHMLDEELSPISVSLQWEDPSEGSFWLRKLPPGLVRVAKKASVESGLVAESQAAVAEKAATNDASASNKLDSVTNTSNSSEHEHERTVTGGGDINGTVPADRKLSTQSLGPLLPYHADDEDLLLSVMIARQTGTGLGFKLTPAYLLQMCVAYCALNRGPESLVALLKKISRQIGSVVADNPSNPEMLLFWASNAMKLSSTLLMDERTAATYRGTIEEEMNRTVDIALGNIRTCATTDVPLPTVLAKTEWSSLQQLRSVVIQHYQSLDANMSYDSLQDVVARICAAMPSPVQPDARKEAQAAKSPMPQSNGLLQLKDGMNLQSSSATDGDDDEGDTPLTSTPANGKSNSTPTDSILGHSVIPHEETTMPSNQQQHRPALQPEPLPEEWEELVDQETKHRFFANHLTRQTSWTDPRDTLRTVILTKGQTGLGLGISGAKRTWDDRLVLGIFVSSLVPESAAALEGTLREGDEILEVNGHSLIGVTREGAIDFLKQVQLGDTVTLLVSQEPDYLRKPHLRHTAL